MQLPSLTLSGNGSSRWIPIGPWLLDPASVGLGLTFSVDANLTASAQYTYDDTTQSPRVVSITRVGATATITDNNHGLNTNDNVQVTSDATGTFGPAPFVPGPSGSPPQSASQPVGYDITVVDHNTYTITVPNSGSLGPVNCSLQSFRVFKHPTLGNQAGAPPAKIDGGLNWQLAAYRLNVSAWVAGSATLVGQQGRGA